MKYCLYCKEEITKGKRPKWYYKKLKYCSLNCANKDRQGDKNPSKRPEIKEKISLSKQKEWANKRSKYHSMNRNWSEKSRIKMSDLKKLEYPTKWNFRKFILRTFPNECFICQKKEDLIVHHKDGNRENNGVTNFVILCASCHNVLHKFVWNINDKNIDRFMELVEILRKAERSGEVNGL